MKNRKFVKLKVDMYSDTKFKIIDTMEERDLIHYIWTRIITLCGQVNLDGDLYLSKTIPYTAETLAIEFNRSVEKVKLALKVFMNLEMIELSKDNVYKISNFVKHQNIKVKEIENENIKVKENENENQKVNNGINEINEINQKELESNCENIIDEVGIYNKNNSAKEERDININDKDKEVNTIEKDKKVNASGEMKLGNGEVKLDSNSKVINFENKCSELIELERNIGPKSDKKKGTRYKKKDNKIENICFDEVEEEEGCVWGDGCAVEGEVIGNFTF